MAHRLDSLAPTGARALILTASGGGAHLTTAEAILERVDSAPMIDMVAEVLGRVGRGGAWAWNRSMAGDRLMLLRMLFRLQRLTELVYRRRIHATLRTRILDHEAEVVLDCQPLGTRALLEAAQWVERITGRPVTVVKVLSEPPSPALRQYFAPIRRLPDRLRRNLHILAGAPLVGEAGTVGDFWRRQLGGEVAGIVDAGRFPVRAAFSSSPDQPLELTTASADEARAIARRCRSFDVAGPHRLVHARDREVPIVTIMLGSQGGTELVYEYARALIDSPRPIGIIAVTRRSDPRRLIDGLVALEDLSDTGSFVLPIGYQPAETVAGLMRCSAAMVVRAGGATSMELLTAGRAQAWIHSAASRADRLERGLLEHELGNFRYLRARYAPGAFLVNPSRVGERAARLFEGDGSGAVELERDLGVGVAGALPQGRDGAGQGE